MSPAPSPRQPFEALAAASRGRARSRAAGPKPAHRRRAAHRSAVGARGRRRRSGRAGAERSRLRRVSGWRDYLERKREAALADVVELLRIPSVSGEPEHADDVRAAADWVARRLRRAGLENAAVVETGGHPAVVGSRDDAPGRPTVLVYGHFDVQPAGPDGAWTTPPFEPNVRDGRLYARGATDDKANVLAAVVAVEALVATASRLPLNVCFVVEGEEEIGSPSLAPLLDARPELLAGCDLALAADAPQVLRDGAPADRRRPRPLQPAGRRPRPRRRPPLGGPRRRGRKPARSPRRAPRDAPRPRRPCRRRRLLRPGAAAHRGGASADRRGAVRRGRVPARVRPLESRGRAGVLAAGAGRRSPRARPQRRLGRLPGAGADDGDPRERAREALVPPRAGPGSAGDREAPRRPLPRARPRGRRGLAVTPRQPLPAVPHPARPPRERGRGARAARPLRARALPRARRPEPADLRPLPLAARHRDRLLRVRARGRAHARPGRVHPGRELRAGADGVVRAARKPFSWFRFCFCTATDGGLRRWRHSRRLLFFWSGRFSSALPPGRCRQVCSPATFSPTTWKRSRRS